MGLILRASIGMAENIYKIRKMSQANLSKKQGFTLVEVIMAMFIFTVMMVAISGVFVSFIKANRHARAVQQDLEDAEYAMNIMAKTLRTSSIVTIGATRYSIEIYDYSQGKCFGYSFNGGNLRVRSVAPTTANDPSTCAANLALLPATAYQNLTNSGNVLLAESGFVRKIETDSNNVGSVTILVTIQEAGTTDKARVQTSVSLHDYSEVNP